MRTVDASPESASPRPSVLLLLGHYVPGYKAGGPVRSIANIVEALGDELDFRIVTADRDLGEAEAYPGIEPFGWRRVGKAMVLYIPDTWRGLLALIRTLLFMPADLLYLNSFFARRYSILAMCLRRVRLFRPRAVLLAPRGEFSTGALRIKKIRKRLYIAVARRLGLYSNVLWHASSQFEERDIHAAFCSGESIAVARPIAPQSAEAGKKIRIATALDLPGAPFIALGAPKLAKAAGRIRLVFLSRISRKKNLDGALAMLRDLSGDVTFHIYGPIEDKAYWKECEGRIAALPSNVQVKYCGEVHHEAVHEVLAQYDALLFPTHGENYGHVIREALAAGCPVIVSDQTPWRGLDLLGVGWDLILREAEAFHSVLQRCIDMDTAAFSEWAARAKEYGINVSRDPEILGQNRRLFARAMGRETAEAGVA